MHCRHRINEYLLRITVRKPFPYKGLKSIWKVGQEMKAIIRFRALKHII